MSFLDQLCTYAYSHTIQFLGASVNDRPDVFPMNESIEHQLRKKNYEGRPWPEDTRLHQVLVAYEYARRAAMEGQK